jgi:hypothetical protein
MVRALIRLRLQNLFDRQGNPEVDAEVLEMIFASRLSCAAFKRKR